MSAVRGRRGQHFLRDLLAALDTMPKKELVADDLQNDRGVCALGALGVKRELDMASLDPEDADLVGRIFDIAPALAPIR